jgi:NADH:quinone reductase (non-electrogenic)
MCGEAGSGRLSANPGEEDNMIKTRITELFGIKYPIIAGPMAYLSTPRLVAAVSNAGGLGILVSTTIATAHELKQQIRQTKALTDRPFAVNVTLAPVVRPINYAEYMMAAVEEGVKIIETSARNPEPYMKMLKDAGAVVMHRATMTRDIVNAEKAGADVVCILGTEAAGVHGPEEVGIFVRIPAAVEAVKIPVVAGGGISEGRGLVAALALGAEGVLMGTRFMASKECDVHPGIRKWLLSLSEADTMVILNSIKVANRVVINRQTEKIREMEQKGAPLEELLPLISGKAGEKAYQDGDTDNAMISVGQGVGLIHDILGVNEIVDGIMSDAGKIMRRLGGMGF